MPRLIEITSWFGTTHVQLKFFDPGPHTDQIELTIRELIGSTPTPLREARFVVPRAAFIRKLDKGVDELIDGLTRKFSYTTKATGS